MEFGACPVEKTLGATLAHSLVYGVFRLKKGHKITPHDINALQNLGVKTLIVAQLGKDDLDENTAAARLGKAFESEGVTVTSAFSGRINLLAQYAGIVRLNSKDIDAFNTVDHSITIATLPDFARVNANTLLATIKIIPYGVSKSNVSQALTSISQNSLTLHPFKPKSVDLILTKTSGFKETLLNKGRDAVLARLNALGLKLNSVSIISHTTRAVADTISATQSEIVLILGASATSDHKDVAPAGLIAAGGELNRFGMPVDPGNLLFLGDIAGRPVIGLPGCVRAPALNGADWILERLAADIPVSNEDIAKMGVGGLLKEVPQRVQPRLQTKPVKNDKIQTILLAAGKSSRMGGDNKLLRKIGGETLLRRTVKTLLNSQSSDLIVVVPPDKPALIEALDGLNVKTVIAEDAEKGLSASLRRGLTAVSSDCAAVIVALADMPDLRSEHVDALIQAYDPAVDALICAPVAPNGKRGNPVLFDRRYFEPLSQLSGDVGAKSLIDAQSNYVCAVPADAGVLVDLDTPKAWADWLSQNGQV